MTEDEARMIGRALASALIEALVSHVAPKVETKPQPQRSDPKWMPVAKYARSRGYSRATVNAFVAAGMPSVPSGSGCRVDVRAADEWVKSGGAQRARRLDG